MEHRKALDAARRSTHQAQARDRLLARRRAPVVRITPTAAILARGATTMLTARVSGVDDGTVVWSVTGGVATIVGNTLTFTAGDSPGPFAVTARSRADSTRHAIARIVVRRTVARPAAPAAATRPACGSDRGAPAAAPPDDA